MRWSFFTLCFVAIATTFVAAWSREDQEIFRLRDEVEISEGPDVSFYDFLQIKPSANQDDINKAYKKMSRVLHPDKVKQQFIANKSTGKDTKKTNKKPGVRVSKGPSQAEIRAAAKAASDRFSRLGLVTAILRGPGRARYDHFLSNGFPKWKGTGYYYARFRPGLGSVLVGLFIFVGGGGHYIALYMSWKRQQEFVGRYIKFARHAAWGDNLNVPGLDSTEAPPAPAPESEGGEAFAQPMNRRQRRMQEKDSRKEKPEKKPRAVKSSEKSSPTATPPVGAVGPKKRVVAENGKILVVDSAGNVYLEQKDEDGEMHEFLLDPEELHKPTVHDTALVKFPLWAYDKVAGRFLNKSSTSGAEESDITDDETAAAEATLSDSPDGTEDFEVLEEVKTSAPNGTGKAVRRNNKKGARK